MKIWIPDWPIDYNGLWEEGALFRRYAPRCPPDLPVVWTSKRAIGDFCPASPVPRPGDPLPAPGQAEPGPAPRRGPQVSRRQSFGRRFAVDCVVEGEVSRELLSWESAILSGIFRDLPGFRGNSMESRACGTTAARNPRKTAIPAGPVSLSQPDAPRGRDRAFLPRRSPAQPEPDADHGLRRAS